MQLSGHLCVSVLEPAPEANRGFLHFLLFFLSELNFDNLHRQEEESVLGGASLGGGDRKECGFVSGHFFFFKFCLRCYYFNTFWPHRMACGISVPRPWIRSVPIALAMQGLNLWAAREVPASDIIFNFNILNLLLKHKLQPSHHCLLEMQPCLEVCVFNFTTDTCECDS